MKAAECSAKDDVNIRDVFRSFLALSKITLEGDDSASLKRRSSAHAGSKSPCPSSRGSISMQGSSGSGSGSPSHVTGAAGSSSSGGFYNFHGTPPKTPTSPGGPSSYQQFLTEDSALSPGNRNKPRSRSLIRRCSKKVKQQVRDASTGPGDCQMS